ncbi:hypothetical protein [Herbiconiux sp. VKM Ac-2851]|uniref:hypothetical protein n=1 Tax=Herbiconiux sp. VKM Ac-2851 TaxID=2739025 RepID=UPI001567213B|nr:hypothetical protein [Herbiconiux sp. VKM Ac-2851]NQX34237.1 hypothetical protein [Herbiconiux sp. VKM Ac-2851]
MGIRYFAQPLDPAAVAEARADPVAHLWSDRHHAFAHHGDPLPVAIDLDKAWRDFQAIFGERPAGRLVAGNVTHTCCGWRSHYGVLDPDEVRAVADDLRSVVLPRSPDDDHLDDSASDRADEYGYLGEMLDRARQRCDEYARAGLALIYSIG